MKKIITVFLFISLSIGTAIAAQIPSSIDPMMLEQFKQLSPAQQRSLAQSMGIDFSDLQKMLNTTGKGKKSKKDKVLQQYFPRGTEFNDSGMPLPSEYTYDMFTEEETEEETDELKPFGYDVFAVAPNTFAPSMDIAIPDEYVVGVGDTIFIQIFGKENYSYEVPVSREGKIIIPELGSFAVSGLTFIELKKYLKNIINEQLIGAEVITTITDLRSIRVFVLGDAFKPGQYVLSSLSSITHALFSAGGISDIGTLRNVELKRNGKVISQLDLYDLLIKGDSSNDLLLKTGDVIFIPPVGERVTVEGEIKRPGIYELSEQESFQDIIRIAGGLLPTAYLKSSIVERFNDNNLRTVQNLDFTDSKDLSQKVKSGDHIKIVKTSDVYDDSITLIGAVTRPGKYQWVPEMKISDVIPAIHAYLEEDAEVNYSIVVREKGIGRNIEIHQFSIHNALTYPNSKENFTLESRDKVIIFSNVESENVDVRSLESLAFTKDELKEIDKKEAEEAYDEKTFWETYDAESTSNLAQGTGDSDTEKQALEQTFKSMDEITRKDSDELDINTLGYFSRKRLLAPIIEQLKRQASAGTPIQLVEVEGAVKFPGLYPLAKNAKVTDAILAAGGLKESAYLGNAEITRDDITLNNASKISMNINLGAALSGVEAANISLKSKDRINIHQIPSWQENHIVELKGEFKFPGKYTIRRGETLGQLIERVGGFTDFAYEQASLFTREKLKELEVQNLIKVSESLRMEIASKNLANQSGPSINYDQARKLLADITQVKPVGRLVVDIPRILSDDTFDVPLEDGDVLYVPTKQNSVNVIGQVQVATSHIYQPGLDAIEYVNLSGGMKIQADDERIYVIKANGSVEIPSSGSWFASNDYELQPGDTVVVPLDSSYMENIQLWKVSTQIIYQAAVAIAAISGI